MYLHAFPNTVLPNNWGKLKMKEVEEHTTWSRSIAKKGSEGSTLLAVLMKSYFFGANTQTIALQTLI